MKKYVLLKLVGLAILAMAILVIISFIEVAIYSYLINPGQTEKFYDAHAMISAPYISCIFGFMLFFAVAWHWKRKAYEPLLRLIILYPLTYILLDAVLLTSFGVQWSDHLLTFLVCNGAKLLGSYTAYKFAK